MGIAWTLLVGWLAVPETARVEVEIFLEPRAPITAAQEWLRELARAGLTQVRIRAKQESDRVGIEVQGAVGQPVYRVIGMIDTPNELVLPSGRFRLSQARQAVQWLEEVARKGPGQKAQAPEPARPLGLSAERLQQLKKTLGQPVGTSTKGKHRGEVVQQIAAQVGVTLRIDEPLGQALAGAAPAEELKGLAAGTAMAYLLRPAGLCMVPLANRAGRWELVVRPLADGKAGWPVGWPPEEPVPELLPGLFESFHANLQNVAVTQAMEAIGQRLKATVLWDRLAMERQGIDPAKVYVTLPRTRTTHHGLIRRVLAKAELRYEVRADDAGRPLVWVTPFKPL